MFTQTTPPHSVRHLGRLVLLAALAMGQAQAATSQSSGCNDQARRLSTKGGETATSTTSCGAMTLTFTILDQGVTLSTPKWCESGRRVQSSDCFTCGEPSQGNHCLDRQFFVNVKVFGMNGANPCPTGPSSVPESVSEFVQSMSCAELPLIHEENVGCSGSGPCAVGTPLDDAYSHGSVTPGNRPGALRREWRGSLAGTMPGPQPNPYRVFLAALPRDGEEELPAELAAVLSAHAPLAGASGISARVEFVYPRPGVDPVTNVYTLHGTVLADGRFSVVVPRQVPSEGNEEPIVEELAYDGATLFSGLLGAETYQAYAATYPGMAGALANQTACVRPLLTWLANPFDLPRLQGTHYQVEQVSEHGLRITETYPQPEFPAWAGSYVHHIQVTPAGSRIRRSEIFTAGGQLRVRRDYDLFRQVQPGVWRPSEVSEVRYRPDGSGPERIARTRIVAASLLHTDAEEAAALLVWPEPASGWWVVHE